MGRPVYSQPSPWRPPAGQPPSGPPFAPPPQGRPRAGRSPLFWVLVGLGLAAMFGIGGCVACAGVVAVLSERDERAHRRNAISDGQAGAVRLGTARRQILARLGPPARPYEERREQAGDDCLFWNIRDSDVGDQWQLCFARGRLTAKYRWS